MAENSDTETVRKELEKQIGDLRKEVSKLSKTVSARTEEIYRQARDEAEEAYESASRQARGAAKQVRRQAYAVSEAIKENPGTAATVLSSAGLLGFLIGLVVGQAISSSNDRSSRWY